MFFISISKNRKLIVIVIVIVTFIKIEKLLDICFKKIMNLKKYTSIHIANNFEINYYFVQSIANS